MTLLIVDDEYYLVQGVKNAISWADYGIDTVLEAYSAEQALARFAEQKIDIMLADVEMPRENGLSLIRKVVERGYGSINILLTGHANFNYAKEAIQLKVFDYLLKPVEIPQLTQVIGKACDELERQRKESMAAEQVLNRSGSTSTRTWKTRRWTGRASRKRFTSIRTTFPSCSTRRRERCFLPISRRSGSNWQRNCWSRRTGRWRRSESRQDSRTILISTGSSRN